MFGQQILERTIAATRIGGTWQYHSRSDAHSKAACWGIMFDLMIECPLLREHAASNRVGFGINHEMQDFRLNRKKNLDLVVCRPKEAPSTASKTLSDLAVDYGIVLTDEERSVLAGLPSLRQAQVGAVLIALEAKACMTAHRKARPRLYDELSSSHETIHGDTEGAIAIGFVLVNVSTTFLSPTQTVTDGARPTNLHKQPADARCVVDKVKEIARRSEDSGRGFDSLGIVAIDMANSGGAVHVLTTPPVEYGIDANFTYERMVHRAAQFYASRFARL